jgi:hypothetical protein
MNRGSVSAGKPRDDSQELKAKEDIATARLEPVADVWDIQKLRVRIRDLVPGKVDGITD